MFLASKSFQVTAVDRSEAGIKKLNRLCEKFSIPINARVYDIRDFPWTQQYDLVMGHGILYYLENAQWRHLLTQAKQHTKPGGFHIYTIFMHDDDYPCTPETKAAHYLGSFAPYELQFFYDDWDECRFDKYVKWDAHPGIPLHYHPIEKLVSRKPKGKPIKFTKQAITESPKISEQQFQSIEIGMSTTELITLIGETHQIDSFKVSGHQYGPSGLTHNHTATVNSYTLELWYYGQHVIYIINGVVDGRALYYTQPQRLISQLTSETE